MTVRRLVLTWGMLMVLTTLAGVAAGVSGKARPGSLALVALAVIIVAKSRLILARYLRLEQAPGVLAGFTAAVATVMAIVTLVFVVDLELKSPARPATPPASQSPSR